MTNKEWNRSLVMTEFEKKAAELGWITTNLNPENKDFVGNPSKSPVGPFRNEPGKEYDVTKEKGKDLIEKAHKKSVSVADAMGKGALVENILEQQEKDIEIATNMPSGALVQVHADLINSLVKIANRLDNQKKFRESELVDDLISKISRPFVNEQVILKEAFWPALLLGLSSITGAGTAANMGFFSSKREDLSTDIKDLYEILKTASQSKWYKSTSSPSAQKALEILTPFVSKFDGLSLKDDKDVAKFAESLSQFKPILSQIGILSKKVELELGESRWFELGQDRPARVMAKYEDVVKDFEFISSRLNAISEIGQKSPTQHPIPGNNISSLQSILVENNLLSNKNATGQITEETIKAAQKLEEWITEKLTSLKINKSFRGKIISDGKLVINPSKLSEIISLIK